MKKYLGLKILKSPSKKPKPDPLPFHPAYHSIYLYADFSKLYASLIASSL